MQKVNLLHLKGYDAWLIHDEIMTNHRNYSSPSAPVLSLVSTDESWINLNDPEAKETREGLEAKRNIHISLPQEG
ncbi:hypothetical protein TNCV_2577311 [Trichonephila clavipes]|nr:hypothetical protein TNCV_2577311 [Trichonephila clavipes]